MISGTFQAEWSHSAAALAAEPLGRYHRSPDWYACRKAPVLSDAKMEQSARHVVFIGHVQGVGFRFTAHRMANRHQLTGFVRNLPDGTVEMLAQGSAEDIDDCIRDMKESFTGYLREAVIQEVPPDPRYTAFKITF